jgi:predicted nucleic acid-binding protein
MIVVSDTSPVTALLTVGQVDLLARLFGEVVIPEAVQRELLKSHTRLPEWLRVQRLHNREQA